MRSSDSVIHALGVRPLRRRESELPRHTQGGGPRIGTWDSVERAASVCQVNWLLQSLHSGTPARCSPTCSAQNGQGTLGVWACPLHFFRPRGKFGVIFPIAQTGNGAGGRGGRMAVHDHTAQKLRLRVPTGAPLLRTGPESGL